MSTLKVNAIQDANGVPQFLPKAWANFDGTTGAIRASGGISSITRNSVGNWTLNFTNAFSDTNYAVSVAGCCDGYNTSGLSLANSYTLSTTQFQFAWSAISGTSNVAFDGARMYVMVIR